MNQTPEQISRDHIDKMLAGSGWVVQGYKQKILAAGRGVAIREYITYSGLADYILFVNKSQSASSRPSDRKKGLRLSMVENQSTEYAPAKTSTSNN